MEQKPIVLIKYGGNAMLNDELKSAVVANIKKLQESGTKVVLVHGGGPFIKNILKTVGIES